MKVGLITDLGQLDDDGFNDLAALEAKRAGGKTISAVGGFKEPPVDRFIAGYKAGATAAVPGTAVKWGYSQDWDGQVKCKELVPSS